MSEVKNNARSQESAGLAVISMIIHRYVESMFEELEAMGFSNVELIEKSEYFLKILIPNFKKHHFDQVLNVLNELNTEAKTDPFYQGLIVMRAISDRDMNILDKIVVDKFSFEDGEKINMSEESFLFGAFLIENIYKFVKKFRENDAINNISITEFKEMMDGKFDDLVLAAVKHSQLMPDKSKN